MKKAVLLIILSIIIGIVIVLIFNIVFFALKYRAPEIEYDKYLNYFGDVKMKRIMTKLGYKFINRNFPYKNKNDFKIIICSIPVNPDNIGDWRKWIKKDKRLIVFYNRMEIMHSKTYKEKPYKNSIAQRSATIDIESNHKLLNGVKKLHIDTGNQIFPDDGRIFKNEIKPVLTQDNKVLICLEKINGGEIIYIADYKIFSDKSVLKNDNAVLLNNLLKDYINDKIVFDRVANTDDEKAILYPDEKNKTMLLFRGNFKFITIQIILLTIIFFLVFIKRFGPALDKEIFTRRSLLRHLEAVGFFFEKGKNKSVYLNILDKYFIHRLQNIIKIRTSKVKNIDFITDIKKRYNLTDEEEDMFNFNSNYRTVSRENRREKFIKKLKGFK